MSIGHDVINSKPKPKKLGSKNKETKETVNANKKPPVILEIAKIAPVKRYKIDGTVCELDFVRKISPEEHDRILEICKQHGFDEGMLDKLKAFMG